MCDSHNAVTFCCWVSSSQVPTILRGFNVFIFLQLLDPDNGVTMNVTMWGITVIDRALYATVTMMTTVPAATMTMTTTTTTTTTKQQQLILMFLKDTKNRFSIILFSKKLLSQDDRNKNGGIIGRTVCMFCT